MPFIQRLVQPTFLSRRYSSNGGATAAQYSFATPSSALSVPNSGSRVSSSSPNAKEASASASSSAHYDSGVNSLAIGIVTAASTISTATVTVAAVASESSCNRIAEGNDVITCTEFSGATGNGGSSVNGKSGFMNRTTTTTTEKTKTAAMVVTDGGYEFETVTNITLSNALRQMASILIIANEIFLELNGELQNIANRSKCLKEKINILEKKVDEYDPKVVNVPVSDLGTFAQIKIHYKHKDIFNKELFTRDTRSRSVLALYEAAGKTPINLIKHEKGALDNIDNFGLLCTPVLGQTTRKMKTRIDADIEIRLPAAIEELRKWTSTEAIGDITVTPDCMNRINGNVITTTTTTTTTAASTNDTIIQQTDIVSHISGTSSTAITDVIDSSSAFTRDHYLSANTILDDDNYPLDHRLPSPEEQCKIIAKRFPAEIIAVDISGCRFDRLAMARKSMMSTVATTATTAAASAAATTSTKCDQSGLNSINQTVTRRQRSRRIRSKRRNTIAGTDQKEIEEAVNGEMPSENLPENDNSTTVIATATTITQMNKIERSRSSDILKNDSTTTNTLTALDIGKATLTKFSSLKEWGRNRLRLIGNRNDDTINKTKSLDVSNEQQIISNEAGTSSKDKKKTSEKDKRSLHERKPSYSSSEKGTPSLSSEPINSVKLRDTSSLKRQRNRNVMKKEDLHSSSGNWSASSESGRTSIASEITVQPKSSASSSSLNHCHQFHQNIGPMGSVPSRRRFLNTSASSSAASDGTATPDLQMCDPFYDDETSSAYSCDTEGYYTSFHVDSGLKTLKEEEPVTPLQSCSALSSSNSFETSVNQTILTAENEYEIFGRGSTSTTTSSAGTVCTALLATDNETNNQVPVVPERKSSLTKLNRSNSNTSASNSTLERSISSSTVGSTLERSGTIKRNGVLVQKEVSALIHQEETSQKYLPHKIDSSDNKENMPQTSAESQEEQQQQHRKNQAELEYSECSDIEGCDRVERIRQKTEINTGRIPSMCIITPTTSDDETTKDSLNNELHAVYKETHFDAVHTNVSKESTIKNKKERTQIININKDTGYATIQTLDSPTDEGITVKDANFNHSKRSRLQPLNNMLGKLKGVLPTLKKSPTETESVDDEEIEVDEPIYDAAGEYVRISDVSNNNKPFRSINWTKKNLDAVLSGNLDEETEYVSLNELPCSIRNESNNLLPMHVVVNVSRESETNEKIDNSITTITTTTITTPAAIAATTECLSKDDSHTIKSTTTPRVTENTIEGELSKAARVLFDAQGKIIYNSDSLKRRKGAHTTFIPGPFVKDIADSPSSKVMIPASYTIFGDSKSSLNSSANYIGRSKNLTDLYGNSQNKNFTSFSSGNTATNNSNKIGIVNVGEKLGQKNRMFLANGNNNNNNNNSKPNTTIINSSNMGQLGNESESAIISNSDFDQREEDFQHLHHQRPDINEMNTSSMLASLNNKFSILSSSPSSSSSSPTPSAATALPYESSFRRDNRCYWTLQSNKRNSQRHINKLSSDDYTLNTSNPDISKTIDLNNDTLKTTPQGFQTYFSPISKRNTSSVGNFKTSTPLKDSTDRFGFSSSSAIADTSVSSPPRSSLISRKFASSPRDNIETASSKVCSDRFGTSKTSLMDFKKLLLATSSKTGTNKKLSAVELLKLNKAEAQKKLTSTASPASSSPSPLSQPIKSLAIQSSSPSPAISSLNTTMNILELSNSPKTYSKRRNFRLDNNLGSPSKSFGKQRGAGWRMNATRTDVISTAIPEANSEEDSSGSDNTIGRPIMTSTPQQQQQQQNDQEKQQNVPEKLIIDDKVDLKKNIFLQAEKNNFMRSEVLKRSFKAVVQNSNNSNSSGCTFTNINSSVIREQDENLQEENKPQIEQRSSQSQQQQQQQQQQQEQSQQQQLSNSSKVSNTSGLTDKITKMIKDPLALETAL